MCQFSVYTPFHRLSIPMKVHEFTLILTTEPNEEEADRLYSIFDDGTIATSAGVPQIHFHREASSLEKAIGSALENVKVAGFDAIRVEIEPQLIEVIEADVSETLHTP